MTEGWTNSDAVGSGDIFHALHAGLTVSLISTERAQLMTCAPDETLTDVMSRNTEPYDFLPVVRSSDGQRGQIVGLFHAENFFNQAPTDGYVEQHYAPLAEEYLIGADASILAFIIDADEKPCRLVVSGANIVGLVSLSDLQKLPVRAALFALITGFEISMFEAIKKSFPRNEDWKQFLKSDRRDKIVKEIDKSHEADGFIDELLFTQFCDKRDIILNGFQLSKIKSVIERQLRRVQVLRDKLAHANDYASSPEQARNVCAVVRSLLKLREKVAVIEPLAPVTSETRVARKGGK